MFKFPRSIPSRRSLSLIGSTVLASSILFGPENLAAADYQYLPTGTSAWGTPGNWSPTGVPNAVGDIARVTSNISTNESVDLGGVSRTVGALYIGDTNNTGSFTLTNGSLLMNNGGAGSLIQQSSTSRGDNINVGVTLSDNLTINNLSANSLNINSTISGTTQSVTLSGNIAFGGGAKTFTGGLFVGSGTTVGANSGNSLGSGTVTLNSGGILQSGGNDVARSSAYVFNGGTYRGLANNSNYNNQGNVVVQSGGGIFISDIAGGGSYQQYSFGTLSIGTGTLTGRTRNSSGGSVGGTGNLTFGATTLTGDATFNTIAAIDGNSVGNASVQLNIGALGDGGVARSVTISGVSNTNFTSAATSLVSGTNFTLIGTSSLTLGSNTAIGTQALITTGSGTNFNTNNTGTVTVGGLSGAGGSVNLSSNQQFIIGSGNNLTSSYSGIIQGGNNGSSIVKAGGGNQTLSGANTYAGSTTINAGTLTVGSNAPSGANGALGNATSDVLLGASSGTANASLLTGGAFTVGRIITLQSGNSGILTVGGNTANTSTFSGVINLGVTSSTTAKTGTFVALAGGTVNFSGIVKENTSVLASSVVIGDASHSGTVQFSNTANAYDGNTTITNGATLEVVKLGNRGTNSSLGNANLSTNPAASATALVLDSGTLKYTGSGDTTDRLFTVTANGGTLDASGASNAAVSFAAATAMTASGTGNRTLTLAGTSIGANTLAAIIVDPSSGATSLTKSGSGTWIVNGASTYTGATTVAAAGGTLNIDSNGTTVARLANTANVTINTGGTLLLSQTGTTVSTNRINNSATVTLAGGTFALGGKSEGMAGTSGLGALTLIANSIINFGTGSNNNVVQFSGVGSHVANAVLSITNWDGIAGNGGAQERLLFAGAASDFSSLYNSDDVTFNGISGYNAIQFSGFYEITAVPEPSTYLGSGFILAFVVWNQRRKWALKRN